MATSLYERLGGAYSIAAVVDDFIDRVMDNPRLNANPKVDEAHHRVSRAGFKYYVTEMVCWATGGPQRYSGRSMLESHAHLGITEEEWQVFLADFRALPGEISRPRGRTSRALRHRGQHEEGYRPADWRKVVSTASTAQPRRGDERVGSR
jgi:hemoglobin